MQRLKTRTQFQAVLAGSIVAKTTHFALHCSRIDVSGAVSQISKTVVRSEASMLAPLLCQQNIWIGALVPKRWAKQAVTRNAIRRQIYAVSRECCGSYPQSALVVRLRCSFARNLFLSAMSDQLKKVVRAEIQTLMEIGAKAT